ncbi:MAG TPA: hypothetical protein VKB35_19700 [Ktedonobacteraceae bacterium]|nr:hypothetical protein [Ktedonobacteraceae bacterium]
MKAQKGLPAEVDDGPTEEPLPITEKVILRGLLDLGREALYMLQEAMRAFDRADSKLLQNATQLFWIAQKLKQFADHAKKICKRVIYIVEGESSPP